MFINQIFLPLSSRIRLKKQSYFSLSLTILCIVAATGYTARGQYCTPATLNGCSLGDTYTSFTTSGGFTQINHNPGTICLNDTTGYMHFGNCEQNLSAAPGTTISFSITNNALNNEGYAIWVDWNADQVFEPGELVYASANAAEPGEVITGGFVVPADAVPGLTRLRVRNARDLTGTTIDPCLSGVYSSGITFDFPFLVTNTAPALAPTFAGGDLQNLSVCNTGTATAINTLLTISDSSHTLQLTWAPNRLPAHGTLTAAYTTISNGGDNATTGLTYLADPAYSGPDTFSVAVNDGLIGCVLTTVAVTTNLVPVMVGHADTAVCDGTSLRLGFAADLANTSFVWTNSNPAIGLSGSGTDSLIFLATNTTTFPDTATITVTPVINGCAGIPDTMNLIVRPTPADALPYNQIVCNGAATIAVTFNITVSGTTYSWTNDDTAIGVGMAGVNFVPPFVAVNNDSLTDTAHFTVTPIANGCAGPTSPFNIVVYPAPVLAAVPDTTVCNGSHLPSLILASPVAGASFTWTNNRPSIGLAASGTDSIPAFTALNTGSNIDTATLVITPLANGCTGGINPIHIIVLPTPVAIVPSVVSVCNGATLPEITFSGPVAGTTFTWSATTNTFGLPEEGSNTVAPFLIINPTYTDDTSIISVTPAANGCIGSVTTFPVYAHPTPTVNQVAPQVLCNGASTDTVFFTGDVTGTTFNWTKNTVSIGDVAAGGTGPIPAFIATDTTSATDTATFIVTPVYAGCPGEPDTFMMAVFPRPSVIIPSDTEVCNGSMFPTLYFTSAVAGSNFLWTSSNPSLGMTASGADSITAFTAVNSGHTPDTSIITVVPYANGCTGPSAQYRFMVAPTPSVDPQVLLTFCNGSLTTTIHFTGPVEGTRFNWNNDAPGTGLPASGTGDIAPFIAVNSGFALDTAHIIVMPVRNGCTGPADTFSLVVFPSPDVFGAVSQSVCAGSPSQPITPSSHVTGTTFSWVNNNTAIGLSDSGNSQINAFIAINPGNDPDTATVIITPSANGCTGIPDTLSIVVNPLPVLSSALRDTICSGSTFTYTPSSAVAGSSYAWSRNASSHIAPASATGSSLISETLVSDTLTAVTVSYVYTLTANACISQDTLSVVVEPLPAAPHIDIHPASSLCAGTLYQNFGTATAASSQIMYNWYSPDIARVWAQGAGHEYSLVSFPETGNATVVLASGVPGIGCYSYDTFTVTVGTDISTTPSVLYAGGNFLCLLANQDSYQWGFDDRFSLDSAVLKGETNQNYYNPAPDFENKFYWVITRNGDCSQKTYVNTPLLVKQTPESIGSINIYPNPATDQLDVDVAAGYTGIATICVTDVLGRPIAYSVTSQNHAHFQITDWAPGIYLVALYQDGVRCGTSKFIKQ